MAIFVVGLPSSLRGIFIADCRRRGQLCEFSLIVKKQYRYVFNPPNGQSVADLERFSDEVPNWADMTVVVLPYVDPSHKMQETLQVLSEEGANVIRPIAGSGDWPLQLMGQDPGDDFTDEAYKALKALLGWEAMAVAPAFRFTRSAEKLEDYEILGNALEQCDEIHHSRHRFLKASAEALEKICKKKGLVQMSLEAFFSEKGLNLAQSGGINTFVCLMSGARQIHKYSSSMHLKEGDGTTAVAAPRIYFQQINRGDQYRLYLLYVGPHPSHDVSCNVDWKYN